MSKKLILISGVLALMGMALLTHADPPKPDPKAALQKIQQEKLDKKKAREEAIKKLEDKLAPLMKYSIEELNLAITIKVLEKYDGCQIYSDEEKPKYLGKIADEFASDSTFNDYGTYGSEYSSDSIWNEYGTYGGEYSSKSPFNSYSSSPPLIVKNGKVIGRLTVNKYVTGAVAPNWLKSFFKY